MNKKENKNLNWQQKFLLIVFNALWILSVTYLLIKGQSISKNLTYSLYTGVPFLVFGLIVLIHELVSEKIFNLLGIVTGIPLLMIVAIIGGFIYYALGITLSDGYDKYYQWLNSSPITYINKCLSVSGLVIFFGFIFFIGKSQSQSIYGFHECGIGILTAILSISNHDMLKDENGFYVGMLTLSVYLFVSGLTNIDEAIKNGNDTFIKNIKDKIIRRNKQKKINLNI